MVSTRKRVLTILSRLCETVGIDPAAFIARLNDGMDRYGANNHLRADFDLRAEWDAELLDVVCFPVLAVSRGEIAANNPVLGVYLRAAKTMIAAQQALLSQQERDGAAGCYGDLVPAATMECCGGDVPQWDADDHDA